VAEDGEMMATKGTQKKIVVLNIGGSILVPDSVDGEYIRAFRRTILPFIKMGYGFYIVVGGGKLARRYISAARELGADESYLDDIGIDASRLNARVLISALLDLAHPEVQTSFSDAVSAGRSFPVVLMGGTHPGHTTDAVAAMLAERAGASELVIATNVKGVYDKDPRKFKDAKFQPRLDYDTLIDITATREAGAGPTAVVDPLACKIVKRAKIPLKVVDGRDLTNLGKAIKGEEFEGTLVR